MKQSTGPRAGSPRAKTRSMRRGCSSNTNHPGSIRRTLPGTNSDLIFMNADEAVNWTACRFASREDPLNAPRLLIEYEPPRIDPAHVAGNQFRSDFHERR